ncbi:MAG TPA: hypothetical protein VIK11_10215 [Tepidiformaceae bacterium]|jgi:hypothetical protein
MPISQHRMALAPLFVAVVAVLFISGSSVYANTRPGHAHAAPPPMVAVPSPEAAFVGPVEPNYTTIGPSLPGPTPVVETPSDASAAPVLVPSAADAEPTVQAASTGGPETIGPDKLPPTVLGPQFSIATVALSHVGTYGGECWVFMQDVVHEATGRTVGTDYVKGFQRAGGYEIPVDEAGAGDIIEVLDNRYTTWDADYPGMHTSIVIENHHDGSFTVVEANAEWDGMVTLNTKYVPGNAVKQMPWLSVHAFHVPQTLPSVTTALP